MTALNEWSAAELGAAYAARSLSPLEVARATIAHIESHEPATVRDVRLRP